MPRPLLTGLMLLTLAACSQEVAQAPEEGGDGTARIASLEDYALPVDKSAQITAIDAATGDASGMPRDGGAVIKLKEPEARPSADASDAAANVMAAVPVVTPPPPPPSAPALTIPLGN